jgi:hypothetical protein
MERFLGRTNRTRTGGFRGRQSARDAIKLLTNQTLDENATPSTDLESIGRSGASGRRLHSVNLFTTSDGFVVFYVTCVIITIMLIIFNMHVIYFTKRRLVKLTANDRYLICVIITQAILALVVLVNLPMRSFSPGLINRGLLWIVTDTLFLSLQCNTLALLVDRYLFINQGIMYDSFDHDRRAKVIIVIMLTLSLAINIGIELSNVRLARRIYKHFVLVLSIITCGFGIYKNVKIYQITAYALTEQQKIDFIRRRGKKLLVLFVDMIITLLQIYAPLLTFMALLEVQYGIVNIHIRSIMSYPWNIRLFLMCIYIMWYIIVDKKWRYLYQTHGLFTIFYQNNGFEITI